MDALLRSSGLVMKALVGPLKDFKGEGEEADISKFLTKNLTHRWGGM